MTINNKTTFKELKKLVGSTKELAKLPTAKELRNSNEEIVFDGDVAGAHFIIYKSGLFIYSRSGHATVYAVDRCTEIEYLIPLMRTSVRSMLVLTRMQRMGTSTPRSTAVFKSILCATF